MNRAGEAAVPEAKTLLIGAVKSMTVTDAKYILLGNDDAATKYFRRKTEITLGEKFKPIVSQSMEKVGLAQAYDRFAGKGLKLGLIDDRDANLEDYITHKAMDGLFLMMAEQEKKCAPTRCKLLEIWRRKSSPSCADSNARSGLTALSSKPALPLTPLKNDRRIFLLRACLKASPNANGRILRVKQTGCCDYKQSAPNPLGQSNRSRGQIQL